MVGGYHKMRNCTEGLSIRKAVMKVKVGLKPSSLCSTLQVYTLRPQVTSETLLVS